MPLQPILWSQSRTNPQNWVRMPVDRWRRTTRSASAVLDAGTVASLPALRPCPPLAERGPSLESRPIYRVSLTVDLCEGNKIISLKKNYFTTASWGSSKKIRGPWARAQCAHWLRRPCAGKPINREIHSNFSQY